MKHVTSIFFVIFLASCTHMNVITFDIAGQIDCEASYTSFGKSARNPQAEVCGSKFGATHSSFDELANLIPTEEILKAYLGRTEPPKIPHIPAFPDEKEKEEDIRPPKVTPNPQPDHDKVSLDYYRRTNGNRPTFYAWQTQPLLNIGDEVRVVIGDYDETYTIKKRKKGGMGADGADNFVLKNSGEPGRGITVLLPASYNGPKTPAYISIK